jgi:L-amino acid N-acyltransferase YncA
MIEKSESNDLKEIHEIINDAAIAYKNIIPADCWHEPYMPMDELKTQISQEVELWCYKEDGKIFGVMGIQDRGEVTLIRHAYVRTVPRNKGIGGKLLAHLTTLTNKPKPLWYWQMLIGRHDDRPGALTEFNKYARIDHSNSRRLANHSRYSI